MDSEWIDAQTDGSDLRAGDLVRFNTRDESNTPRIVIRVENNTVITSGPQQWTRDRSAMAARWQYHAPTRAKLVAADRERVTVTSITSDTVIVQAPPPDSEPGWDHVPVERINAGTTDHARPGDRFCSENLLGRIAWRTVAIDRGAMRARTDYWIRRAEHPERVRWLEERKRAVNTDSALVAAVDSESTYARAPSASTFPDECKPLMHFVPGEFVAPVAPLPDPFAAVRAEAKLMLDGGADPRVVLGALDECVRREDPSMWKLQLVYYTVEAIKNTARHIARASNGPCYHGNRASTCGWCALSRDRSDSHTVESHEPAWETADCEGE